MALKKIIYIFLLLLPAVAVAEETLEPQCHGSLYRAKVEGVPVYSEADETAEVLVNLKLGQEVCYVGEDNSKDRPFAILDWRKESESKKELAFVVLSELWPPREQKGKSPKLVGAAGILQRATNYLRRMRSGHPPSDALEPYRGILNGLGKKEKLEEEGSEADSDIK